MRYAETVPWSKPIWDQPHECFVGIRLRSVEAGYGYARILHGISFAVRKDDAVAILGRNGVGKTTIVNTFLGIARLLSGRVHLQGTKYRDIRHYSAACAGIATVMQGRGILSNLTVRENLLLGAAPKRRGPWSLRRVYELFRFLAERADSLGNALSGGQQQMLAIGRALMANPDLLVLDEPSEGLAPVIVTTLPKCCDGYPTGRHCHIADRAEPEPGRTGGPFVPRALEGTGSRTGTTRQYDPGGTAKTHRHLKRRNTNAQCFVCIDGGHCHRAGGIPCRPRRRCHSHRHTDLSSWTLCRTRRGGRTRAEFAAKEVNAKGGVDGRKVELEYADTEGNPDAGRRAAEKLVRNGYRLLTGTISSAVGLAIGGQMEKGDALYISSINKSDRLTGEACNARVFRADHSDSMDMALIGPWLKSRPEREWGVMAADYGWGHQFADAFTAGATVAGKTIKIRTLRAARHQGLRAVHPADQRCRGAGFVGG